MFLSYSSSVFKSFADNFFYLDGTCEADMKFAKQFSGPTVWGGVSFLSGMERNETLFAGTVSSTNGR